MLSRIAESLYWIGRYVERAEDTARITDVNYHHTVGMGTSAEAETRRTRHWEALISIVGNETRFRGAYGEANEETVPTYLTFDPSNPNSIVSCVARSRELARTMRHQIASEMWEALNRFYLELQEHKAFGEGPLSIENAHLFYRSVIEFSHLFQGVTDSTMPREEGWHFLHAGKFLERAEKTARALDVKYHLLVADAAPHAAVSGPDFEAAAARIEEDIPGEWHQWQAVLRSMSAYEAYHKLYRSAVEPREVVEMLTLSPVFPRSILFSITEVEDALARISAYRTYDPEHRAILGAALLPISPGGGSEAERAVGILRSRLAYGRVEEIFETGLHAYLIDLQRACYRLGESIQAEYFAARVLRPEDVVA
ncbi:MAG: alpha-E domain-containing protein [Thermomicrobiales bacterium]